MKSNSMFVKLGMAIVLCSALVLVAAFAPAQVSQAASSSKQLSTNFTLVNFGTSVATVQVQYLLDSGAAWTAPAGSTNFTIPANGGQKIIRQYQDVMTPSSGRGSAVVSSDQPLGAVVQISAQGQVPTSGAYSGYSSGAGSFYVPLLARRGNSANGTTNSQVMVQNTGSSAVTVDIKLIGSNAGSNNYTKTVSIQTGATYYYDLDDETNLNTPWAGSGVVTAQGGGAVAVVGNFFTGPNAMQTYNAFASDNVSTVWLVPLFVSRLGNGLSTPITIQNISGASIAAGGISMTCTRNNATAPTTLTYSNSAAVDNNKTFIVNPVTNLTIPASWQGSCKITSTGNTVAFVQMRYSGGTGNPSDAAAHEAINGNGTDTKVIVPLVAKRLGNGFATAVTIQNLSATTPANVTLTYTHGTNPALNMSTTAVIPAGASLVQNQRLAGFSVGATVMPEKWQGSLTVASTNGVALGGFVQLTYVNSSAGDTFMAHNAFTLP